MKNILILLSKLAEWEPDAIPELGINSTQTTTIINPTQKVDTEIIKNISGKF
jgi:hypothetical protein